MRPVDRLADLEFNIRAFMVRVTDDRDAVIEQIAGFVQVEPSLRRRVAVRADRMRRRSSSTTSYAAANVGDSAT